VRGVYIKVPEYQRTDSDEIAIADRDRSEGADVGRSQMQQMTGIGSALGVSGPTDHGLDRLISYLTHLLRQAARLLVERPAAHAQGMRSSIREAGQRLKSLASTSAK
jgi:hypothetical protein